MHHLMLRHIVWALLLSIFATLSAPQFAWADNSTDCFNGTLGQRVAPCSAVIADTLTTPFDLELALQNRSTDFLHAKKYAEALQDVERALQLNPQSSTALNGRAWVLYRWKKTDAGMDDVNRSIQLNGLYAPAWDTRAHLYQMQGRYTEAFDNYEAAVGFGGEYMIRSYQCGLKERGLYKGPVDGIYSAAMRTALRACSTSATCDPLPENEFQQECESATS